MIVDFPGGQNNICPFSNTTTGSESAADIGCEFLTVLEVGEDVQAALVLMLVVIGHRFILQAIKAVYKAFL